MRTSAFFLSAYVATGIQAARDYSVSEWLTGMLFMTGTIFLFGVLPLVVVFLVLPTLVAEKLPIEEHHEHARRTSGHHGHPGIVGGLVGAVVGLAIILALVVPWSPAHDWVMHFEGGVSAVALATLVMLVPLLSIFVFAGWFRHRHH